MSLSFFWLILVLTTIVTAFLLASKYASRRTLFFLLAAIFLVFMGHVTKLYSAEEVWYNLNESTSILSMIVSLQIFSVAMIEVEIPERFMRYVLGKEISPVNIQIILILITYGLSLLINNLATILIILPFALRLAKDLEFDTKPFLVALVVSSNLGGASMMIGDFPNIVISRHANATFLDFFINLGVPILLFLLPLLFVVYRPHLNQIRKNSEDLSFRERIQRTKDYYIWQYEKHKFQTFKQLIVVGLFVSMSIILAISSKYFNFDPAFIILLFSSVLLIFLNFSDKIFKKIDLDVLVFFASLFVISGALQTTFFVDKSAEYILSFHAIDPVVPILIFLLLSALITSFLNAGPSTVLLIPLTRSLQVLDPSGLLWWTLSLGVLAGSSATPIGATAGYVTIGMYEREIEDTFAFTDFLKVSLQMAMVFLIISGFYLFLMLRIF